MTGPRTGAGGFTLLELLVAVTLLGFIALAVFSALGVATRSADAGEAEAERSYEMRLVQELLRRRLGEAIPVYLSRDEGWELRFSGERSRLSFVVEMQPVFGVGGLYELELSQTGQDEPVVLRGQLLDASSGGASRAGAPFFETILVPRPATLVIDYYGSRHGETPGWYPEWAAEPFLPRMVRVAFETDSGSPWPPLAVHLPSHGKRHLRVRGAPDEEPPDEAGASAETLAEDEYLQDELTEEELDLLRELEADGEGEADE